MTIIATKLEGRHCGSGNRSRRESAGGGGRRGGAGPGAGGSDSGPGSGRKPIFGVVFLTCLPC